MIYLLLLTVSVKGQDTKVLFEQFTGTWCGWCPYGHEALNTMKAQYGDDLVILVYHSRDDLASEKGNELIKYLKPFYPSGVINRNKYPGSDKFHIGRSDWQRTVEYQMGNRASLELKTEEVKYNESSREVEFQIKMFSRRPMNKKYRFNVVLTEDHLLAKQKIYAKPYKELKDFYHSFVVREMITGTFGESFTFTKKVIRPQNREKRQREIAEFSFSKKFSFKIDSKYTDKYCHVVVFVHEDTGSGFGPAVQATELQISALIQKSK